MGNGEAPKCGVVAERPENEENDGSDDEDNNELEVNDGVGLDDEKIEAEKRRNLQNMGDTRRATQAVLN